MTLNECSDIEYRLKTAYGEGVAEERELIFQFIRVYADTMRQRGKAYTAEGRHVHAAGCYVKAAGLDELIRELENRWHRAHLLPVYSEEKKSQ